MTSGLDQAIKKGLPQKVLDDEILDLELLKQAINILLEKQKLVMFSQGKNIMYKEQSLEVAVKFKDLTSKDLLVYQSIANTANRGIWTADLKTKTSLQLPEVNKALKNLKGRSLVKAVRTCTNKNRKVYMLFELTPSREVTGGPWYGTDQVYDAEFVDVVKQQFLQFITKQGLADLQAISYVIRKSDIQVELGLKDFKQIMDALVLDGDVEVLVGDVTHSSETVRYRVAKLRIPETSALTNVPCGACPVLHECSPGSLVSPKTCIYLDNWLSF